MFQYFLVSFVTVPAQPQSNKSAEKTCTGMARKEKTVGEVLDKLDEHQKEKLEKLRSIVKNTVPDAVEFLRRGKIAYSVNGKDFAWISAFENHLDVDFLCGTRMDSELLKERGKQGNLRHVEIRSDNFDETELKRLLVQSSEISC